MQPSLLVDSIAKSPRSAELPAVRHAPCVRGVRTSSFCSEHGYLCIVSLVNSLRRNGEVGRGKNAAFAQKIRELIRAEHAVFAASRTDCVIEFRLIESVRAGCRNGKIMRNRTADACRTRRAGKLHAESGHQSKLGLFGRNRLEKLCQFRRNLKCNIVCARSGIAAPEERVNQREGAARNRIASDVERT